MYHISLEMKRHVLSIYDSLSFKFTDLYYIIRQKNMGHLSTLLGLPEFSTGLASRVDINDQHLHWTWKHVKVV
jgi:hypothetical protein